jgi:hypothetical protein
MEMGDGGDERRKLEERKDGERRKRGRRVSSSCPRRRKRDFGERKRKKADLSQG